MMRCALVALACVSGGLVAEGKTTEELTAQYGAQANASCAQVAKSAPALPTGDQAAFMAAYSAYDATDATTLVAAASKVLSDKAVANFLSAADSFGAGGLDAAMVQCAVINAATPAGLAAFAVQGAGEEASVDALLKDGLLMRDMLVAGGPEGNKYGEAASIYAKIKKASSAVGGTVREASFWDSREQSSVLQRLALGTALALADNKTERFPPHASIDPVKRYLNFETAYKAGLLDPYFEVMTVFELRYSVNFDGADDDMDWLRSTMYNIRPEYVVLDGVWRYSETVHTDVAYGHSVWPDGVETYRDLPAAGAVCGGRAFWGRFCKHSFGLPTLAFPQPGHGCLITWGADGWVVELGAPWPKGHVADSQGARSGPDFKLETDTREDRAAFQKVLRGGWVAAALQEAPVSRVWVPGTGPAAQKGPAAGNWSALMFAEKVVATQTPAPTRELGPSVVATKQAALAAIFSTPVPKPRATVAADGSITIPAAGYSYANGSSKLGVRRTLDGVNGTQVESAGIDFEDPDATAFEYTVESADGGSFYFVANFSTWHVNTDLQLSTNTTKSPLEVPVFYTVGEWMETPPLEVTLLKGTNVLRFVRQLGAGLVFKEFFLLKKKPSVPLPPGNHTPAPAPPPVDKYIQLRSGLSCESQGIKDLDSEECGYAAAHFGFKYTGARQRPTQSGCWGLISGDYKGNANLNANASAPCCDADKVSLCLRQ
eukprot:Hpha_TRINITY_DN16840_c3_g3::TRINITY_DN16840_c3_g3_i1::g.152443::m.152443